MPENYDLAIIGSGSGNSLATHELASWRIALIEQNPVFGGTCLNVGCIPTKMFVYPASLATGAREAARLGIDAEVQPARWTEIRDRTFGRIDAISAGGREYRLHGSPNVDLYEAHAEFASPHELRLSTGETITADRIVLATGSRATVPDRVLESGVHFHTSDTVMRIDALPKRVLILGGGYIACEFAHVFSGLGSQVSVVCRGEALLRDHDADIAAAFTERAREQWNVHVGVVFESLTTLPDGTIRSELSDGAVIEADLLLVATGRVPNTDRLSIEKSGVALLPDGRVDVDEHQRTSVDHIWAVGDASNEWQLKHVANHETRVVAHNLAHPDDLVASDHRFVPSAVFTHPQVASVGVTEAEAAASGRPYVTAIQGYGSTAYGWAMEDNSSICKLIADPTTGLLLGAHLVGEQASLLIQPLIQAMSFGLRVPDMARGQYWIHPALMEVVENALLSLKIEP